MISQADILKTLINKSCTDDAVMATALSPDCTPPKLLEKLTEAERFDVALDISMKLGLDVIPLWRTWALRALRHKNFSTARDKFRHCFQRFRLPGRSNSSQQSQLLTSILNELCRMQETELPLQEEIELIRKRKLSAYHIDTPQHSNTHSSATSVIEKPGIFNECLYYLESYGTAKDFVRFYARNFLWNQVAEYLIKNNKQVQFIQMKQFFIEEVFQYSSINGQLNRLLEAFIKLDPDIVHSAAYFKAMVEQCLNNQKFHLLYHLQHYSGNYLDASYTQIYHIFLRKPVHSYHELNARLPSLLEARKNCQDFLDSPTNNNKCLLANQTLPISLTTTETLQQSTGKPWPESKAAAERQIKTINQQIEITRNFAANEVTGCINGIEFSIKSDSLSSPSPFCETKPDNANSNMANAESNNDIPVTLFDTSNRRKTFFAALVLTYFDLSCTTYFSKNGLDLAKQLIDDYDLDELALFKLAMQILMRDESCDIFKNANLLLDRIREYYATSGTGCELAGKAKPPSAQHKSSLQASSVQRLVGQPMANLRLSSTPSRLPKIKPGSGGISTSSNSIKDKSTKRRQAMSDNGIRAVCDEVILDSIKSCAEYDYKMELAKLLSSEAQIEFYISSGKLSNAQRLACNLNRPDYVSRIIKEAARLNQEHVKTVCQLWLAKHETRNLLH